MDDVKVSVIIATYNTADYISECLDSIVTQTLREIEIIIIDDGSTDNTQEILKHYTEYYRNIYVYYQENMGAGLARNKGIDMAKGEYMVFMDPDDKYPIADCLEIMYRTIKEKDVIICGGNILGNDNGKIAYVYSAGDGTEEKINNDVIESRDYFYLYGHTRYMFQGEFIKKENIRFAPYKRYEDQIVTINALGKAGKFYELNYPVYEYRINYRRNQYDKDMYLHIFKGFRDTLRLICSYNMKLMYEKNCANFISSYMPQICKFMHSGEKDFIQVIGEINDIIKESGWSTERDLITHEKIEQNIRDYIDTQNRLDDICKSNMKIIIYGAGKNTQKFLSCYKEKLRNLVGIAVTNKNEIEELEGIAVRLIREYLSIKNEALVLVTPSKKSRQAIFSVLDELGFSNYEWIDVNFEYVLD